MWRHFVYLHQRQSDGVTFYIGKGSMPKKAKSQAYDRAYETTSRNRIWQRTVAKHGIQIEIVASCIDDSEAQRLERALILAIGRRDLGLGPLINLTDGGDGSAGIIQTNSARAKRSAAASRPRSPAWIASIRAARRGGGNGGVVKAGDKLPESWKANIAAAKIGVLNPFFGKPSPPSKKVVNRDTGAVYDSIARAAKAEGVPAYMLYQYLDGTRRNRTPLERL